MATDKISELSKNCKDITGQRFGRLVATEAAEKRSGGHIVWQCICDCGKIVYIRSDSLRSGSTKSCECLLKEMAAERSTTHGMHGTPIYYIWQSMLQRCENPNYREFKYWGGRGIKVCERWHKFENFYEDVGDPPEGESIDRWPDNDGDYEFRNFRWATPKEQSANRRPKSCSPQRQRRFRAWHKDSMAQYLSNNQNEFAKKWNLSQGIISACLRDKEKQHKGWEFKYC